MGMGMGLEHLTGEVGGAGTAQPGGGKALGDLIHVYKFLVEDDPKRWSSVFLSGAQQKDKR